MMNDELKEHGIKCVPSGVKYPKCDNCPYETVPAVEGVQVDDIATNDATNDTLDAIEENQPSESDQNLPPFEFDPRGTEAANILAYLASYPEATNKETITALHSFGMEISSSQVSTARKKIRETAVETSETDPTLEE